MHIPDGFQQVNGAWIHPQAEISPGVRIDPGAVVGAGVVVGPETWIASGAVVYGPTILGAGNQVHPGAVLGGAPQDVAYAGEPTRLLVGDHCVFREAVTVHRGSVKGGGETRIGSHCYFMVGSHIGHDCAVGDRVVLANDVLIAGHCRIGNNVNIAGGVAMVQFTTVGRFAFMGGLSGTSCDVEPFIAHDEMPSRPKSINVVGLRRGQVPHETIKKLKEAFRVLFSSSMAGSGDLVEARKEIERRGAICDEVLELLDFMQRSRNGRFGRQAQAHAQPQPPSKLKLIPEEED